MKRLITLLVLTYCAQVGAQSSPTFAQLSLSTDINVSEPLPSRVVLTAWSKTPQKHAQAVADNTNVTVLDRDEQSITVALSNNNAYQGTFLPAQLAPSFVIDFDEKATQPFISGFTPSKDEDIKAQIVEYVSGYITEPSYVHGFNFASTVAQQRSGDCTEYAVLTTALSRSEGIPAKLILGIVVVQYPHGLYAYGHAWSEIWVEGQWHTADAALYNDGAIATFYLPSSELQNESMAYSRTLMESMASMPSKITAFQRGDDYQE